MIKITRINSQDLNNDKPNYTVIIRRFFDKTYYTSNPEGLKLKDGFKSEKDAIDWAYRILPEE